MSRSTLSCCRLLATVTVALLFAVLYVCPAAAARDEPSPSTPHTQTTAAMIGGRAGGGSGESKAAAPRPRLQSCTKNDVVVYHDVGRPLPNGIPTYVAEVLNECLSGCSVSDIHLACGWFASTLLIDPRVFRRLAYNDCLVNDGAPLGPGESVSFQYSNNFPYPLDLAYASCS